MKKFSILLITYNQEKYIVETIESVLSQTYQNFEIIVSDDCSTDNTLEIAKSINDERIKVFSTPFNVGINGNINNAIKNASGDYLILLGGDDKLRPTCLEKLSETFNTNDVDVIYSHITSIDQDNNYIIGENSFLWKCENKSEKEMLYHLFLIWNCRPSPGMCLSKEAALSLIPLDYSLINFQDYKMHVDLMINGYKNIVLDEILVDYRIFNDERNVSNKTDGIDKKRWLLETDKLMDSFLRIKDVSLLESIFKEEIDKTGIKPYNNTVPFFLGQMALLSNDVNKQIWGYKQITKFISDYDNYKLTKDLYDFDFKQLLNLVKQIKFDETSKILEKEIEKCRKKHKKYKRLFDTTLIAGVISIVLNIVLILGRVLYGL